TNTCCTLALPSRQGRYDRVPETLLVGRRITAELAKRTTNVRRVARHVCLPVLPSAHQPVSLRDLSSAGLFPTVRRDWRSRSEPASGMRTERRIGRRKNHGRERRGFCLWEQDHLSVGGRCSLNCLKIKGGGGVVPAGYVRFSQSPPAPRPKK